MRHTDAHCTLDEVGQALGVTRERARQIESRALVKFRAEIERRHAQWNAAPYETVTGPQPELRHECRELVAAIDTLPEAQRAAILLVALEDVDYQEGAWILGIPVGTLRSRLSRGREALRRHMNDDTAEPAALRSVK